MVEGAIFIGAAVVAVTDAIKDLAPRVKGAITVAVAALLGLLVALIDAEIGIVDMTVAEGILTGLSAAGVVGVAKRIG